MHKAAGDRLKKMITHICKGLFNWIRGIKFHFCHNK